MTELQLGDVTIGDGRPVVVIAEAACEHLGDLGRALEMVDAAKEAGVDVIKFQLHLPEEMIAGSIQFWGGSMDDVIERLNLPVEDHVALMERCREVGIQYLCTPFSLRAAELLDEVGIAGFKTGSGEMTNLPMLRGMARLGRPMIVSTGMATVDEILETVGALRAEGAEFMLMNCTSAYPPRYDQLHLGFMRRLRELTGVLVGHSDHTPDWVSAVAAVALGAPVIEKHFTLDRELRGPDWTVSLEPDEMRRAVQAIRDTEAALGEDKELYPEEEVVRAWAHHSVVTVRPVAEGVALAPDDLAVKRPGGGIPARHLEEVVGRVAVRALPVDHLLAWDDLRDE
ncbi:MAG TPA: N-acetylneuraminate synthase family protein [Gaiellaceae bacterium]|nr:N-acetylneuraminate synthase family protein [Gaiellaceae bacterium]